MNFDRPSLELFFQCAAQVASLQVKPSRWHRSERTWWYVVSDSAQVRRDASDNYPDLVYPWAHPTHARGQFNGVTFYHNYSEESLLHAVGELLSVASCRYKLVSSRSAYGKLAALISPNAGLQSTVQIFPPQKTRARSHGPVYHFGPTLARCGLVQESGSPGLSRREGASVTFDSYGELASSNYSEYTRW